MLKAFFVGALTMALCLSMARGSNPATAPTVGKNTAIPKAIAGIVTTTDPNGKLQSYQPGGATITANNAFFQSLGTNGRSCFSCHRPQDGWSISAADATARFKATRGKDPIFTPADGATNPTDDVSSMAAMKTAYQLLLGQGLIRIARPMPSDEFLQFSITSVSDPYGCNTDATLGLSSATSGTVSIYRRPLPATNLKFDSTLMWDGRESNLDTQAIDATMIHAQSTTPLDDAELKQIVGFESGIFTAQAKANGVDLWSNGAMGGPVAVSIQRFFVGINDPFDANPIGTPFDPHIFNPFEAWANPINSGSKAVRELRQSIERGEQIFNTKTFTISGVAGLNDVLGQVSIAGTCGTCHDTPNVGSRSVDGPLDIGTSDPSRVAPALPLPAFTIRCDKGPLAGQTFFTFDPGRAMITGKCEDLGKVKVPSLRGLAARAPYFHNGSAADIPAVISFYQRRFFTFSLNAQAQTDLTNFLNSL